jgi:hypothetical protein
MLDTVCQVHQGPRVKSEISSVLRLFSPSLRVDWLATVAQRDLSLYLNPAVLRSRQDSPGGSGAAQVSIAELDSPWAVWLRAWHEQAALR